MKKPHKLRKLILINTLVLTFYMVLIGCGGENRKVGQQQASDVTQSAESSKATNKLYFTVEEEQGNATALFTYEGIAEKFSFIENKYFGNDVIRVNAKGGIKISDYEFGRINCNDYSYEKDDSGEYISVDGSDILYRAGDYYVWAWNSSIPKEVLLSGDIRTQERPFVILSPSKDKDGCFYGSMLEMVTVDEAIRIADFMNQCLTIYPENVSAGQKPEGVDVSDWTSYQEEYNKALKNK